MRPPIPEGSNASAATNLRSTLDEPIAIIGMGCRLPGAVSSASQLWDFLMSGRSAQGDFPSSRFNGDVFYDAKSDNHGSLSMKGGYFLSSDIRLFDNAFFGINNLEAMHMDPQQRNLLEVVFECFENAGIRLSDVAGANVGCFVGDFVDDYAIMTLKDPEMLHRYSATGSSRTILANRVSHVFDLRGPSLTLDTACSSSMYCLHMACSALILRDCDSAVVASANLIQTPEQQMRVAAAGVLSNTSTCHTFDSTADGYGRGDAIGAIYLKRLSDALRDNDSIRSIVRSTAVNSDGFTPGITLPSAASQEAVIARAYESVGLEREDTDYVECHGTGTPVGDPIEVSAIANVMSNGLLPPARALRIGSVKPNFGHSEAASAITSILKATLALENLQIPPTTGIQSLNPNIPWQACNVEVVQSPIEWPRSSLPNHIPRVGINSFGYGGANAHCILDHAESYVRLARGPQSSLYPIQAVNGDIGRRVNGSDETDGLHIPKRSHENHSHSAVRLSNLVHHGHDSEAGGDSLTKSPAPLHTDNAIAARNEQTKNHLTTQHVESHAPFLLPFSARSSASLSRRVADLALIDTSNISLADLAYTLSERRSELSWRGFVVSSESSLSSNLSVDALALTTRLSPSSPPSLAFIFTGQGAQWHGMGRDLSELYPTFRQSVSRLENHLLRLSQPPAWSLSRSIWATEADKSRLHCPDVSQTACTAIQIALVDLLREWGVTPAFVVGHSSGEIAASYAAGHISATFAIEIAYLRGQALLTVPAKEGAMMAIGMGQREAEDLISSCGIQDQLCVACINSPESVTLSGDLDAIDCMLEILQKRAVFTRKLRTGGQAYHSHHMLDIGKNYETMLRNTSLGEKRNGQLGSTSVASQTTMISSVHNRPTYQRETSDPLYWRTNLESPVLFSSAVEQLLEREPKLQFVEIGPHGALGAAVKQISASLQIDTDRNTYISALSRGIQWHTLRLAGDLWASGYPLSLGKVNHATHRPGCRKPRVLHNLPNYGWCYAEPLWAEPRASLEYRGRKFPRDELLGSLIPGANGRTSTWRNLLDLDNVAWLSDHKLGGEIVFPGAGYIAMASRACQQLLPEYDAEARVIEIRDMHIEHALRLQPSSSCEILCELCPRRLNRLKDYVSWYDFTISSIDHERTVRHASGAVGLVTKADMVPIAPLQPIVDAEQQRADDWYRRFLELGLDFGPHFRSLRCVHTPRMRNACNATAELVQPSIDPDYLQNYPYKYDVHPIMIDAIMQAGIIASCAGELELLSAHIPTYIERIQIGHGFDFKKASECYTQTSGAMVGYGIAMLQGELLTPDKRILVKIEGLKASMFRGEQIAEIPRQPMLEVVWNPDLSKLRDDNLTAVSHELSECLNQGSTADAIPLDHLAALLRIVSHGRVNLKILELGPDRTNVSKALMLSVDADTSASRAESYHRFTPDNQGQGSFHELHWSDPPDETLTKPSINDKSLKPFDVIVYPGDFDERIHKVLHNLIAKHLAPDGIVLFLDSAIVQVLPTSLEHLCIPMPSSEGCLMLASRLKKVPTLGSYDQSTIADNRIQLIVKDEKHPLNQRLLSALTNDPRGVQIINFDDMNELSLAPKSIILATIELEEALVKDLSAVQLVTIQRMTIRASCILWVTGGSLITSAKPDYSAIFGLQKTVMAENPALRFTVVDLDNTHESPDLTISNLRQLLSDFNAVWRDTDYLQRNGVLYISRMLLDRPSNTIFQERKAASVKNIPLALAGRCELFIREPGQFHTLAFAQLPEPQAIAKDHVEVNMKAAGINAKDLYTLSGKLETKERTCSSEFAGVVTRVGSSVSEYAIGDRVLVSIPGRFNTYTSVPAWTCCKIRDDERFVDLAAVPIAYATAIHALRDKANLQRGESILIHSGAGGVGQAAIHFAKEIGAEIFVTAGTEQKRAHISHHFNIDPSHIFSSRDAAFLPKILALTNSYGVDVELNSLTGELLHSSLQACARFGRFIELGKRDLLDAGNLDMRHFLKDLTFSAFDLHELYYSPKEVHQRRCASLFREGVELFRRVRNNASDVTVFDIAHVDDAFLHFANAGRMGKVVLSLEDSSTCIPVVPKEYSTVFSASKSYLLVGCLGGLGRSIARYMLCNGARYFTFLSRSGSDKEAAATLVMDLEKVGASVRVVRGDVSVLSDVQRSVTFLEKPLGGVVQAAMSLQGSLFHSMSQVAWMTALRPKIQGTWNLHKSIANHENQLDFFLITSSIAGTLGSVTESNYSTANQFLDHFAAYRRSQGKPALSMALAPISGAGILHERPELQDVYKRSGVTYLGERDMLQVIDIALSKSMEEHRSGRTKATGRKNAALAQTASFMLTGLEPGLVPKGYESTFELLQRDARLSILALSFRATASTQTILTTNHSNGTMPSSVAAALANTEDTKALQEAVSTVLAQKMSRLVLMPAESIGSEMRFADVGMDSTLAAQFRMFVFRTLGVDVPFMALMDPGARMVDVAERVCEGLRAGPGMSGG